jgi:predicted transglutaminase-like cysteine proteinase
MILLAGILPHADLAPKNLFGSISISMRNIPLLKQAETVVSQQCKIGDRWGGVLKIAKHLPKTQQLSWINNQVFKRIKYKRDRSDYWSPPYETTVRGTGDCEDSALLKLCLLKSLGFSDTKMHIAIVDSYVFTDLHAVLVVRHKGQNFILDELDKKILPDTKIKKYRVMFTINRHGTWVHGNKS